MQVILKSKTKIPYYDALIDDYCAGVHGAVLNNMLPENVKSFILLCTGLCAK